MTGPKVAVVILNWNGKSFLEQFLPTVLKWNPIYAEVIVADNGSSDDSVRFLKETYPHLKILELGENLGYTGGYNTALGMIKADYYVLLNSDIEVRSQWIEPVITLMEQDVSIGACQPRILSWHEPNSFEYAGAAGGYIDYLGYPFCRGRIFNQLEQNTGQYNDTREVFWATGACMFVRAKSFHEVGGFDNSFFAHMEEIDLCWRMKRTGMKVIYCGDAQVYHVGGGTLPVGSPRKTYLNFRNNLLLLAKNLPLTTLLWVMICRLYLDLLAALSFLLAGKPRDCNAVIKAWFSALRLFHQKRKAFKSHPEIRVSGILKKSLVIAFYLFKKDTFSKFKASDFS